MTIRIGHGFDVHRFSEQEEHDAKVVLGGVSIPHSRSIKAHSDGDVLIHALMDALLGSLALGDIGSHFPDTDSAYSDIDSTVLLAEVTKLLSTEGAKLVNTDLTIVAQQPKISPHIASMRSCLSSLLEVEESAISIKATTTEGLGFTGRGEGIACHAVVLIEK